MKRFKPNNLATAIGMALGLTALAVTPVNATDMDAPMGTSSTNTGQIATAYYIASGNSTGGAQQAQPWNTLMNVTNTSDAAIAVKVRIKEFKNSREALDFNVLMSPNDVWTGWLALDKDGDPALFTDDKTCITPFGRDASKDGYYDLIQGKGIKLRTSAFFGGNADDGGSTTAAEAEARLVEGHVEFIVMGMCDDNAGNRENGQCFGVGSSDNDYFPGIGFLTEHDNGINGNGLPRNCELADKYFVADDPIFASGTSIVSPNGSPLASAGAMSALAKVLNHAPGYGPVVGNPLKVNVAYLQTQDGTGSSVTALHFDSVIQVNEDNGAGNLITAQQYPWNLEPTIATAPSGELWNMSALLDLEQMVTWTNTIQEWSVNPANGVQTAVVMNFPTKGYHVDQNCNEIYASNNRWRWNGDDVLACADAWDTTAYNGIVAGKDYKPWVSGNIDGTRFGAVVPPSVAPFRNRWAAGKSDVQFWFLAYNREEKFVDETQVSPERANWYLPWEVAQIVFDKDGGPFGGTPAEVFIDAGDILDSVNGWIDVYFDATKTYGANGTQSGYDGYRGFDQNDHTFAGLPMQALMIKTRYGGDFGQGDNNGFRYCNMTANGTGYEDNIAYGDGDGWGCGVVPNNGAP